MRIANTKIEGLQSIEGLSTKPHKVQKYPLENGFVVRPIDQPPTDQPIFASCGDAEMDQGPRYQGTKVQSLWASCVDGDFFFSTEPAPGQTCARRAYLTSKVILIILLILILLWSLV